MARKQSWTDQEIIDAVKEMNGQVRLVARKLNCTHSTIYRRGAQNPEIREAWESSKDFVTDEIQQVLIEKAIAGEPWAVTFWLKTQAKHRGYTERQEFTGANGQPIEITTIEVIKPSDA